MQHRDVIPRLLAPADEDPAEAVHPTVRPFRHPTPRLEARPPLDLLGPLAPRLDVRRVTPNSSTICRTSS